LEHGPRPVFLTDQLTKLLFEFLPRSLSEGANFLYIEPFPKPGWFQEKYGEGGPKPSFSAKFKVIFSKTEVLGKALSIQ
jgi:hypothetical protein